MHILKYPDGMQRVNTCRILSELHKKVYITNDMALDCFEYCRDINKVTLTLSITHAMVVGEIYSKEEGEEE